MSVLTRGMPPRRLDLTEPERYALLWTSHGLTTAMTADMMGLSPETVNDHLERARLKLAAKNTTHAVANAYRRGLIR